MSLVIDAAEPVVLRSNEAGTAVCGDAVIENVSAKTGFRNRVSKFIAAWTKTTPEDDFENSVW